MRGRLLAVALTLAVASPAAAETFQLGANSTATSQTVLQKDTRYEIAMEGTITFNGQYSYTSEPYREVHDAGYCVEDNDPDHPPKCDASLDVIVYGKLEPYDLAVLNIDDEGSGTSPYAADHRYVHRFTAPATGPLKLTIGPGPREAGTWSGTFTITLAELETRLLCNGRQPTIVGEDQPSAVNQIIGTPGDDIISGTDEVDLILGGGGRDVICAHGGDDSVNGGGGRDVIYGGAGNDKLLGGVNYFSDHLEGGSGNDDLRGGEGVDELYGEADNDQLDSGKSIEEERTNEILDGGAGNDVLVGHHPRVFVLYVRSPRAVRVDLAKGTARGWGDDTLRGILNVTGSRFDDVLAGGERDNVFEGNDGDDRLVGRKGDDRLRGGGDTDRGFGGIGTDTCSTELRTECER